MVLFLIVFAYAFILLLVLLRIFYPSLYAKYVLRIADKRGQSEWLESSSKVVPIAALIVLTLMLLDILFRRSR
jgi:hypothetical protein